MDMTHEVSAFRYNLSSLRNERIEYVTGILGGDYARAQRLINKSWREATEILTSRRARSSSALIVASIGFGLATVGATVNWRLTGSYGEMIPSLLFACGVAGSAGSLAKPMPNQPVFENQFSHGRIDPDAEESARIYRLAQKRITANLRREEGIDQALLPKPRGFAALALKFTH